jgi:hypothetical protein
MAHLTAVVRRRAEKQMEPFIIQNHDELSNNMHSIKQVDAATRGQRLISFIIVPPPNPWFSLPGREALILNNS